MKPSKYNIIFGNPSDKSKAYLINSYSRIATEVPIQLADDISNNRTQEIPQRLVEDLEEIGVLTKDSDFQDVQVIRAYETEQSSNPILNVVLPLTNVCNLACSYCYQVLHGEFRGTEKQDVGNWNAGSIAALVNHLSARLANSRFSELRIRWYGGEPLARIDLIKDIGAKLRSVCTELDITLSGMAVTNGTLLKDEAISVLKDACVDRLEISLDGPKESHDYLRPRANGASSYDAIVNGILNASRIFETVVLRVNVHSVNADLINEWLAINASVFRKKNIFFKFKLVEGDRNNSLTWDTFAHYNLEYLSTLRRLDLKQLQGSLTTELCPAIRDNYLIVQSDLRLYKCPQNLGSDDNIGVISPDGVGLFNARAEIWETYDATKDAECGTCNHLPHCNGGCPYNEVMAKINSVSLDKYSRKERCCREKNRPEIFIPRLL